MEFVIGVVGLCVILFRVCKEKIGSLTFDSDDMAAKRQRKMFIINHTSNDMEHLAKDTFFRCLRTADLDYDPQYSEAILGEIREAVRGTKYWSDFDVESYGASRYAIYILLANRGYVPMWSFTGIGDNIYEYVYTNRPCELKREDIEADIEFLEVIETILHKKNVPYRWMLVSGNRRAQMLWGGLSVNLCSGRYERTLEDVKRDLQTVKERRRQALPPLHPIDG